EFRGLRVEVGYSADDNVTRAPAGDDLKDGILGVRASASLAIPVSTRTRAVFQGFAGGESFRKYKGLSHNFIGGQGEFQFRPSGAFGAPTYSAFLRTAVEQYDSSLRDGYRHLFGVSVFKPLTDRMQFFGALARSVSDGKSAVFDARSTSVRGNLDWLLGRWDTVYLGAEYRGGDSISTVCRDCDPIRTLGFVNTADPNIVEDDAFDDAVRDAYRLKARTLVATLGYNHAFGAGKSLDLSWRRAQSRVQNAVAPASGSDLNYAVSQYSLAFLVRF
ncbi:MAG: hypothetical protein WBO23_13650, partial [Burkholderiales bacterium]